MWQSKKRYLKVCRSAPDPSFCLSKDLRGQMVSPVVCDSLTGCRYQDQRKTRQRDFTEITHHNLTHCF